MKVFGGCGNQVAISNFSKFWYIREEAGQQAKKMEGEDINQYICLLKDTLSLSVDVYTGPGVQVDISKGEESQIILRF